MEQKCKKCKKNRRITQFSLIESKSNPHNDTGEDIRQEVCRVCNYDGLSAADKHKILREAYRNYLSWKDLLTYRTEDEPLDTITYNVPEKPGSDKYVPVTISFSDLSEALKWHMDGLRAEGTVLSKRKEQAFVLNVLEDMLQRDVAEIMGITTVSVGQYVEQAMLQLCDYYFAEDTSKDNSTGAK